MIILQSNDNYYKANKVREKLIFEIFKIRCSIIYMTLVWASLKKRANKDIRCEAHHF